MIKASTQQRVDSLVNDLSATDPSIRESAIARLTLIGGRAVTRLVALAEDRGAEAPKRAAALRALEGIADRRALEPSGRILDDPEPTVAAAAANVIRVFLKSRDSAKAVERLTETALDRSRPDAIRLAALGALADLERSTLEPLAKALGDDASEAVRGAIHRVKSPPAPGRDDASYLKAAVEQTLPEDPSALHASVMKAGDTAPLPLLADLVARVREREASEPPARRAEWVIVRAAGHAALAGRGSRLALYDIRESLESASEPLPVDFLKVLAQIGDASCLESIASADARAAKTGSGENDWWRRHLSDAFRSIASRERLTRRHPVMKKILKRWPSLPALKAPAPRPRT